MQRDKRKKSKMPCLFGGSGENSNRKTVKPRSPSDGITEQNSYTLEVGQTSSKQGYGTPMKTLLAKEMLNETSAKKRSPSLIAKLMGLDGLPSPQPIHRQQRKLSENSHKSTASVGGKRNEKPFSHQLDKKSTMEQQQFKDVYEDLEASHVANKRYSPPMSAKRRSTKQELGYIQERCDEMLRESIAIKSKLERVDSNSDLMLSFLQKPDSLFVKHLHDQQGTPSGSPCNQITVLKPSNFVRHGTHGKGLKEERETSNYGVTNSYQRNADRLVGYSSRSTNNSHRSSRNQLERNEATAISPTRIVVLKPNVAKIYNDKNSVHSPDGCRKNTESECFSSGTGQGGSQMYRGAVGEVRSSRHKSREAREIARQITSQMKEGFESGHVNLFDHGFRGYVGVERMYNMSSSASVSEPEMMVVPSRNSFDRSDRSKHSPSNMSESSVIREAKKRMSQRWKTHGYKDAGMVGKGSTLEEMLSVPNSEMRHDKTGRVVGLVGVSDEYVSSAGSGMPLGISSNDGWRDGYLRNTQRSRSLPPSLRNRSRRTSNHHEAHADEKIVVHNEPLHRGKSKGSKGNFNHIEDLRSKNLRYNKRCQSSQHCNACSLEFANILTEPTMTCFEDEDPTEHEPLISDIHGATTNAASVIDVIRISSESSSELSPGLDVDSSAIDEDSLNSQEPLTAKSGGTVSIRLSGPEPESSEGSKEVDEQGQISVLEVPPTEDVSSGSDCFERVSSQLHELRKQLHLLKMESESTYDSQNEEEVEQGSCFGVSESNNWESTYLTDLLQGSGFSDNDPYTFMTTLYAVDCPTDPWLFDHLEKKYSEDSNVSRSERHLLYDRINEALYVISKSRVSCSWVSPGKRGIQMTLTEIGFEDQLQKVLAKQEKEAREDFEEISIDKDPDWFESVKEIDVVGKQIAELLVNDLVLEIVSV